MRRLLVLAMVAGCTATSRTTPTPEPTASETGGTDDPVTSTEQLRPPVQTEPPNAKGQVPAFKGQTRAPQPAVATAFDVAPFATGLTRPWAIEVLPEGRVLVTERPGNMKIVEADGTVGNPLSGVPDVVAAGQGGLLDVALAPDFGTSRMVYVSFSQDRGSGKNATAVARGALSTDETALEGVEVIFQQQPAWSSDLHFGSRLVFADDGTLFVTLGERSQTSARVLAQDATTHLGAVVRINPDGSVPADNPTFDTPGAQPHLWSKGHRNPQSAALDLEGRLWTVEHGPRGGDELNRPEAGLNYGWPEVTYGQEYSGRPVGDGITARNDVTQPVYFWDPVIAPSGMRFYSGTLFEGWEGSVLIGGLKARSVVRLTLRDDQVYTEEWLSMGARVRDVAVAADGSVLVATDAGSGQILRVTPAKK